MRVLSLVAASSILLGATVAAPAAHYQAHHRMHHYGVYGAEAYGRYGAYGAYDAHGAYGAAPRYGGNGLCPLRWGERPEELTQDRDYQETIGEPC